MIRMADSLIRSVEFSLKRPVVIDYEIIVEGDPHVVYEVDNIVDVLEVIERLKLDERFGFEVVPTPDNFLALYPK